MIAFWVLAPIMVACAVGMVAVRNAVHSALLLAVIMISLAVLYAVQEAPFLFAVQIIVYTGAVLMLFLFVMMLVGVDSTDSLVETIRGQRTAGMLAGIVFAVLLILAITQSTIGAAEGLGKANHDGNVNGLAELLFSRYVFAFEVTSALLITAALGAMVLAHRERLTPKPTQKDMVLQRMREYASDGIHPGPLPSPGSFARHNSVDTPALLPDGTISELSISRVMRARGTVRDVRPGISPSWGASTESDVTQPDQVQDDDVQRLQGRDATPIEGEES
jgi:NADH-quinone oxidoreductase subunit J